MSIVQEEWNGTAEEWDRITTAFQSLAATVAEAIKPVIRTFKDLYNSLAAELGNEEIKKYLRQQSLYDRRQQLQRSIKRQQLLEQNKGKSNNWKRMHGLPAKRRYRKRHTK